MDNNRRAPLFLEHNAPVHGNIQKTVGKFFERVNWLTRFGWIWSLVHSFYTRAKFLFFSIPTLIILIVAYSLISSSDGLRISTHSIFVLAFGVGVLILLIDGVWLVVYRQHLAIIERTNQTLPNHCPFCGGEFSSEKHGSQLLFGFPGARFELTCSLCNTLLVTDYPFRYWTFTKVDEVFNSTFAWLYRGERLDRENLNLVLNKQHADSAKAKLRASGNPDLEHVWFDKPTARAITRLRTGPLEEVISGNMSALSEFNQNILRTPPEVNTAFFKKPSELALRKKEKVILYVAPVRLAVQRSKKGEDYFHTRDTGFFYITNQRVGFRGRKKRNDLMISAIYDLDHNANNVAIRPSRRKTPDYYLDLDGELVYCVLIGLLNSNDLS
jgi:hypothetical protein